MVRLAMIIGKIPFEDEIITFDKWPALKAKTPLGSLPVAEIDGNEYVQTVALTRYFGKLGGLYPSCPLKALQVDQVVETVVDMQTALFSHMGTKKEEMEAVKESVTKVAGRRYWGGIEKMLETFSHGPFVLGDEVSIADIAIAAVFLFLKCEFIDVIPHNALDGYPRMDEVFRSVMDIPEVSEWYKARPVKNL